LRVQEGAALTGIVWDGLDNGGVLVPDGDYKPVVKLERSHRTIVLPNSVRLDTVPPKIFVRHPQYPILSPDGDHHGDVLRVAYRVSEPAHGILYVDGTRVAFTLSQKLTGVLVWNGTLKKDGVLGPAPPGRYVLTVAAQDRAGNTSKPDPFAIARSATSCWRPRIVEAEAALRRPRLDGRAEGALAVHGRSGCSGAAPALPRRRRRAPITSPSSSANTPRAPQWSSG
jgi:hypothetical protein